MKMKGGRLYRSFLCVFCALALGVTCASCSGSSDEEYGKARSVLDTVTIAVATNSFSDGFYQSKANILNAANKEEYAVGLLVSEPIMQRNDDGSWSAKNGVISTRDENGRTVATVRLNDDVKSNNNQLIAIGSYITLIQSIDSLDHKGYFRDFYKYPIEGLVAYRFKCKGLTLADLPDFEAQTKKKLQNITAGEYERLLVKTKIGGLFDGTLSKKSYDGKTFRQTIEEHFGKELPKDYFSVNTPMEMLPDLAAEYAQRPREEWITSLLADTVYDELVNDYAEQIKQDKTRYTPGAAISIRKIDNFSCEITFEKTVSEQEAIEILNLPLCFQSATLRKGDYIFGRSAQGIVGRALSFNRSGDNLTVVTVGEDELIDSILLGQIRAAMLIEQPSGDFLARARESGLRCEKICSAYAVYDENAVTQEFLAGLAMFRF